MPNTNTEFISPISSAPRSLLAQRKSQVCNTSVSTPSPQTDSSRSLLRHQFPEDLVTTSSSPFIIVDEPPVQPTLPETLAFVINSQDNNVPLLRKTKHGYVSVLMKRYGITSYEQLQDFQWKEIVSEFSKFFPVLHKLVLSLMLSPDDRKNSSEVEKVYPRLGLIYAVAIQHRIHNLSLVQRMNAAILTEGLCDVKVCFKVNFSSGNAKHIALFNKLHTHTF